MLHPTRTLAAALCLAGAVGTYPATAVEIFVSGLSDAPDVNPGDGICDADPGPSSFLCTLRAAVMETNALPGQDTLILGDATYTLTVTASGADDDSSGDLNVTDALIIRGSGSSVLDGNEQNRLFLVEAGASLVLSDAEVRDGFADFGGCFRAFGDLTLQRVAVHDCMATQGGGAIHTNNGTLIVEDSWIYLNTAAAASGGGINSFGFTRLERTTLSSNFAGSRGGGLRAGDEAVLVNSTLHFNSTEAIGGGIWITAPGHLYNVTIVGNICDTDSEDGELGGGIFQASQPVTVSSSVLALNFCDFLPSVPSDCSGSFSSSGYNFVGIGTGCSGFTAAGDMVGAGPTPTDPELEPFELSSGFAPGRLPADGSPLIDAGDPTGCKVDRDGSGPGLPVPLNDDQRGLPRIGRCDIGALELGADVVFEDGFETGNVLAWSSSAP